MAGIDDLSCYVPYYYLKIEALSEEKNISFEKLNKGLGLEEMALINSREDAATLAANAVAQLIERNNLTGPQIGKLYVGTESAFDGAKPVASYVLGMLEDHFSGQYGSFRRIDALDMTFACIGGVDALLLTVDWVRSHPDKVGIVVCTDIARYDLDSTGEYTQGAGAVAILVSATPRLMEIGPTVGVACKSEHDFFKPLRHIPADSVASEMLADDGHMHSREPHVAIHRNTPIFDGQFSNACYAARLQEAFEHFKEQDPGTSPLERWSKLVFHLPYAFHGKRIFTEIFAAEKQLDPSDDQDTKSFLREVAASEAYRAFVAEYIEKGQFASSRTGNLYTASIFLSLMSLLELEYSENADLADRYIGFCAYGSGSKAKVFEGRLLDGWSSVVSRWHLFRHLDRRKAVSFIEYEGLHLRLPDAELPEPEAKFILREISESPLYGERTYMWKNQGHP